MVQEIGFAYTLSANTTYLLYTLTGEIVFKAKLRRSETEGAEAVQESTGTFSLSQRDTYTLHLSQDQPHCLLAVIIMIQFHVYNNIVL